MALVGDNDKGREYPYVGQGVCRKSWYLTLNFAVKLKPLLFKKKKMLNDIIHLMFSLKRYFGIKVKNTHDQKKIEIKGT